jgi:hypothetical protein
MSPGAITSLPLTREPFLSPSSPASPCPLHPLPSSDSLNQPKTALPGSPLSRADCSVLYFAEHRSSPRGQDRALALARRLASIGRSRTGGDVLLQVAAEQEGPPRDCVGGGVPPRGGAVPGPGCEHRHRRLRW